MKKIDLTHFFAELRLFHYQHPTQDELNVGIISIRLFPAFASPNSVPLPSKHTPGKIPNGRWTERLPAVQTASPSRESTKLLWISQLPLVFQLPPALLSFHLGNLQVISQSSSNFAVLCIIFTYHICRRNSPNSIYYTEKDRDLFSFPPLTQPFTQVRAASSSEDYFLLFPKRYL